MHLSYNVIKENRILDKDVKTISTDVNLNLEEEAQNIQGETGITYEEARSYINNYEKIGMEIIEDAKRKKNEYIIEMTEKGKDIEKEAYNKGYDQGLINGREDGRNEAFEKAVPEAKQEAQHIIDEAEDILKSAKIEYDKFLEDKRQEIINMTLDIAYQVLKREVQDADSLNGLIDEAIKLSKGAENVIIKCNPKYKEELEGHKEMWKTLSNIEGEIFILPDVNMEFGSAIVEKSTGKVEVGIDIGLDRIKEALSSM